MRQLQEERMSEVTKMGGLGKALADKNRNEGIAKGIKEGEKRKQDSILNNIIKNLMNANTSLTREEATEQAKALIV